MVLVFLAVILTVVLNGTVHGSLKIFKFNSITSQEIEFLKLLWGLIFVHLKTIILHRIQNSTPTHPLPVPMHTPMYTLMDICRKKHKVLVFNGFLGGSDGKESACNVGDLGWEDPLETGISTHSSILPGESPWTEEPGGLQSMRLQRVRHD